MRVFSNKKLKLSFLFLNVIFINRFQRMLKTYFVLIVYKIHYKDRILPILTIRSPIL
jgi:hypothetical protein